MDTETKPGWKTTEFWGKNGAQLVAIGAGAYALWTGHTLTPEQQLGVVKSVVGAVGFMESAYAVARGLAKRPN